MADKPCEGPQRWSNEWQQFHFAIVCADLRGYRRSSCPASAPNHAPYAKRSMARDLVSMMQQLGFERFSVAGHDRGGRVAYRMAPDHPDRVDRLAVLDILPTETVWEHAEEGGPIALWRAWCDEVQGLALDAGYFFPEEAPEQTADALNLKNHQTFALFTTLL